MQSSMKNPIILLIVIAIITCIIYVVDASKKNAGNRTQTQIKPYGVPLPQSNSTPNPSTLPLIKAMPHVPADINYTITAFPDLDRQRLERENLTLLPANEIIQTSYKDWNVGTNNNSGNVEKELYSTLPPLFKQSGGALVPLDVNGTNRRINFY
jgi:hypothetical protein